MTGNMNLRWRAKYGRIPSHVPIACNKFPQSLKPPPPWPANQSMTSGYSTASNRNCQGLRMMIMWLICFLGIIPAAYAPPDSAEYFMILDHEWLMWLRADTSEWPSHLRLPARARNGTERKGSYKQGNSIVYYYYPTDSSVPRKWLA